MTPAPRGHRHLCARALVHLRAIYQDPASGVTVACVRTFFREKGEGERAGPGSGRGCGSYGWLHGVHGRSCRVCCFQRKHFVCSVFFFLAFGGFTHCICSGLLVARRISHLLAAGDSSLDVGGREGRGESPAWACFINAPAPRRRLCLLVHQLRRNFSSLLRPLGRQPKPTPLRDPIGFPSLPQATCLLLCVG